MLAELSHLMLILAGIFSAFSVVLYKKHGSYYANLSFTFILLSFIGLLSLFLLDDFSVRYVAMNSSLELATIYKFTAIWAGHEGSMLLWVLILSGYTVFSKCFLFDSELEIFNKSLSILSFICLAFILFILFTSNPFLRLLPLAPDNGQDLNPLLQDIGLIIHPPLLYLGYVGTSVPFALAYGFLWQAYQDSSFKDSKLLLSHFKLLISPLRISALIAWGFLTIGIMLGSWWAYYELGWGGFWFWDPVENASLMPWLALTALLHSILLARWKPILMKACLLLSMTSFSFSILGTFLVRSGILSSVHSFAFSPAKGLYILVFLLLVVIPFVYWYLSLGRLATIQLNKISRESFMYLGILLLSSALLTLFLGTIYPLIYDSLGLGQISVGAPYFNRISKVLGIPLLVLMSFGQLLKYKALEKNKLLDVILESRILLHIGFVVLSCSFVYLLGVDKGLALLSIALSTLILTTTLQALLFRYKSELKLIPLSLWGMFLAHLGMGVSVLGIGILLSYEINKEVVLAKGDTTIVSGYQFKLEDVKRGSGSNYKSIIATVGSLQIL